MNATLGNNSNSHAESNARNIGEVAVIGGGPAGLLAALAVEPFSKSVRVFERRLYLVQGDTSVGLQQEQGYAIVSGGLDAIQQLSPSLFEALISGGACLADASAQVRFYEGPAISPTSTSNLRILTASRAYIAQAIHAQVQLYPRIRIELATVEHVYPEGNKAIVEKEGEKLSFDLVIDASGRRPMSDNHRPFSHNFYSARHPTALCYEPDVTVRSMIVDSWKGYDQDWALLIGNTPPPEGRVGSQIMRIENGKVQIAVAQRYSRGSPTATAAEIIRTSLPAAIALSVTDHLKDIMLRKQRYRFAYRTRIDREKRHPVSFLMIGDAFMSTNPIYGLGISSAAIQARELRNVLQERMRANNNKLIVHTYYESIRKSSNLAWSISRWTDKFYPESNKTLFHALKLISKIRYAAMRDKTACSILYRAIALSTSDGFGRTLLEMVVAASRSLISRFARSIWPKPRENRDVAFPDSAPQIKDKKPRL